MRLYDIPILILSLNILMITEGIVTICPSTAFTTEEILTGLTTLQTRIPTTSTTRTTSTTTTTTTTTTLGTCAMCDPDDITVDLLTSPFAIPFSNDSIAIVDGCQVRTFICTSADPAGTVIISVNGAGPADSATVPGTGSISIQVTCDEDSMWEYQVNPVDPSSIFIPTTVMCEDLM